MSTVRTIALSPASARVQLRWPMSVGVVPPLDAPRAFLRNLSAKGKAARLFKIAPLDSIDLAVIPNGGNAVKEVLSCPVRASALLLADVANPASKEVEAQVLRLVQLTGAQAVAIVKAELDEDRWFADFIAELSRGVSWQAALWETGFTDAALYATDEFQNAVIRPPSAALGFESLNVDAAGDGEPEPPHKGQRAIPPDPFEHSVPVPSKAERYAQANVTAAGQVAPVDCLTPGAAYQLHARIAPPEEGWIISDKAIREPEFQADEQFITLRVEFRERNSCPDGVLKTIDLPRTGPSTVADFDFTASAAAHDFDGRIAIYHNNRPLTEIAMRMEIVASGTKPANPPRLETILHTRSYDGGLADTHSIAAATIRIEDDKLSVIRGDAKPATIRLPGYRDALQAMERSINDIDLEQISPQNWSTNEQAAKLLVALAQQGAQLHAQLMDEELMRQAYGESAGLLTVLAADAATRVPLELAYALDEPVDEAAICPGAVEAARAGACLQDCVGRTSGGQHVCPMGFWGMQRTFEWRSPEADEDAAATSPGPDRETLHPMRSVLYAHSSRVEALGRLPIVLTEVAGESQEAADWNAWKVTVKDHRPSMLLLLPHVDKRAKPPRMEIGGVMKNPPGVKPDEVAAPGAQEPPLVMILGCGAATFAIDFQSLPNQFRRGKAAVVVAPMAEILARDAPEIAATLLDQIGKHRGPLAEAILAAKRELVANGYLAGLLLFSFGDADWKL